MVTTKKYEYSRIERLADQLQANGVEQKKTDSIMEGGKDILRKTKPEKKAEWLKNAMIKMDTLLDLETCKTVREGCACCLGGRRLKMSKSIAKDNTTLEARLKAANETPYVFGNGVTMEENGEIVVRFFPDGLDQYRCVCLKTAEKIPITYCYCCGGHVKHHLQIALGRELECTARSSALASGGKLGCVFSFKIKTR